LGGCSDAFGYKYLAGHSDVVAGALITKTAELGNNYFSTICY
jgi:cystathionine beta-lyase/cystathionine gamma-synthase